VFVERPLLDCLQRDFVSCFCDEVFTLEIISLRDQAGIWARELG
jgi:hypothetical protein